MMNTGNFELNIQNYTQSELEELFELPPHRPYSKWMVENKESKLRQNIQNDATIAPHRS
jgi:hypothetical protein